MAKEEMGAYKRKGAAESKYLSEDGDVIDQNKKTAGPGKGKMHMDKKVKGPGEYGGNKGDDSKSKKDYEGPGRSMGYTQNFGPARVNSYAKGAAKVNSIMGKGPAEGFFDTAKKVLRTGTRALGDIGMQALDIVRPDHGSDAGGRRAPGATTYGDKVSQKRDEMAHYQKSRDLTAQGKTYFNLSRAFDDDGSGSGIFNSKVPPQTTTASKNKPMSRG
jgi:hypothetical protein